MSEEGVSSVAVVDEESGILIGGVSVTDIGRVSFDYLCQKQETERVVTCVGGCSVAK